MFNQLNIMHSILKSIFCISILTLAISCSKNEDKNLFYWSQTGCSDPWGVSGNDKENVSEAVENYLEDLDVEVIKIEFEFKESEQLACLACNCTTGNRIIIQVSEEDVNMVLEIGFKKLD